MNHVQDYVRRLQATLDMLPEEKIYEVVELLHEARVNQRLILVMGNGGSAATASHMVCDLMKNTRKDDLPNLRVIGLADNMPVFSALGNDEGYENVFAGQLASYAGPGDVVIAISASGNSPNVLKAVELANQIGARTVGLTGYDGGKLGQMVDLHVNVPSDNIEQVEDIHLVLEHMITSILRSADSPTWNPQVVLQQWSTQISLPQG